jgi:hypothetical protein
VAISSALAVWVSIPGTSVAQDRQEILIRGNQAYEQGNFQQAATLLAYALNPAFDLPDSTWTLTLQRLAHSLLEIDRADLAGVWLRWALRHRGPMTVDDVNFPPAVIRAFAEAGRAVEQTQDSVTPPVGHTRWHWPKEPSDPVALGGIVLAVPLALGSGCRESRPVVAVNRLVNLGPLPLDSVRYLPPETYMLKETGPGCRSRWVHREVLPGVVTEVTAAATLTVQHENEMLLVYLDGKLLGATALRSSSYVRNRLGSHTDLPPVLQVKVLPGVRRIELRDGFTATSVADTTITLNPGDVRVLHFRAPRSDRPDREQWRATRNGKNLSVGEP